MAVKPLTLKRQRAKAGAKSRAFQRTAEVSIAGLPFHLPETFTYGIIEEFDSLIAPGSLVRVPFRNQICEGVVINISDEDRTPVKPILSVSEERIDTQVIDSARAIAERYICRLHDILKLIDPISQGEIDPGDRSRARRGISCKTLKNDWVKEEINRIKQYSSILIVIPTSRELNRAIEEFNRLNIEYVDLREPKIRRGSAKLFLGLRSAIFTQITGLEAIWILEENSEHHWERRNPKWNTRDVALLRYQNEDFELKFLSVCPSLEIWRLQEMGYIKSERERFRRKRSRKIFFNRESLHKAIRLGLENGSVLVSVAGKDYVKALACSKCSSAPRCECGGNLLPTPKNLLRCSLCMKNVSWKCDECDSSKYNIIGKGAEKIKEEFRKSFPNIAIYSSTSEKEVSKVPPNSIVIATNGMEPLGPFGGIVSLDTLFLQNIPELRAEERLRSHLFTLLNSLSEGGVFYLDLSANNRLSRAIALDSPHHAISDELAERVEAKLPPNWRIIRIECEGVSRAIGGLLLEHPEVLVSYESATTAILRAEVSKTAALSNSIRLLQTYRSLSRKSLLNIEMDPFKL